jgi:mannose-6-phosphate isomerase
MRTGGLRVRRFVFCVLSRMSDLYPFLMLPAFDPRPWGTLDLSPIYPNQKFTEKIGESWLTGDNCKVANGPLAGRTLAELSQQFERDLVGQTAADANRFPLLTKFLFPNEKLSVQVHPDDDFARLAGEPCGKTECWYVVEAKPGAQVALGLKAGVTREQLEESIRNQHAEEVLNWIDVHRGDLVYVAGGTVHTLGPGSIIVETQQQSDTTYRLYDYGRPRELHLEAGLAAVKEQVGSGKVVRPQLPPQSENGSIQEQLVAAPYFLVDRLALKKPKSFATADESGMRSAQILVALDGCGVVSAPGKDPVILAKGDAVVIPASIWDFQVQPQWELELILARVPGRPLPEPITTL